MTGNKRPLVSVIMRYCNGRRFVREAVQSLLSQTHDNIEVVVVDDASLDKEDSDYMGKIADELVAEKLANLYENEFAFCPKGR